MPYCPPLFFDIEISKYQNFLKFYICVFTLSLFGGSPWITWLACWHRVITQESLTNSITVSWSAAHVGFLYCWRLGGHSPTCRWLWVSLLTLPGYPGCFRRNEIFLSTASSTNQRRSKSHSFCTVYHFVFYIFWGLVGGRVRLSTSQLHLFLHSISETWKPVHVVINK